jgi:hypothetical protein
MEVGCPFSIPATRLGSLLNGVSHIAFHTGTVSGRSNWVLSQSGGGRDPFAAFLPDLIESQGFGVTR